MESFMENIVWNNPYKIKSVPIITTTTVPVNNTKEWILEHADEVEDIIAEGKAKKEKEELARKQQRNKYYRSLVKHIKFSGTACIVYWRNGTQTVVHWDLSEDFDPEKAILAAMAKKLYGDTNIFCEVLKKYAEDGWDHLEKNYPEYYWD